MAKIATLITDKFEDVEFTSPKEALEAAGHTVVTIDKEGNKTVTGKQGDATVQIDHGVADVKPEEFDALFIQAAFHQICYVMMIVLSHLQSTLWMK